jgi:hypothetical protein
MYLAEAYIHLRPYDVSTEEMERLGELIHETAFSAAQDVYGGDVTITIIIETGSAKIRTKVWRTIEVGMMIYGGIADYESFCKQADVIYKESGVFMNRVIERVQHGEETNIHVFRTERRYKTSGKLKRLADLVSELNTKQEQITAEQFHEGIAQIERELASIQKEVTEGEMRRLLEVLSLETLRARVPLPEQPVEMPKAARVLRRPLTHEEEFDLLFTPAAEGDGARPMRESKRIVYDRTTVVPPAHQHLTQEEEEEVPVQLKLEPPPEQTLF